MNYRIIELFLLPAVILVLTFSSGVLRAEDPTWKVNKNGYIVAEPPQVKKKFRNPDWPEAWKKGFNRRATHVIEEVTAKDCCGNTYFENEKRSYGRAMLSILGGEKKEGLKFLQKKDANADSWHKHTKGIDLFACFTLKHQVRKYFYFGPYLKDKYRKRMYQAAKIWTEKDPLGRDHHAFKNKGRGYDPEAVNSWVDTRSTDNLKLMRDTSVYLFAEETNNENVRNTYKKKLKKYITTLYYAGMGEWDSENYLGHSFVPLLNLYDFTEDPEVKKLAKAALDWMSIAAAVKYRRGNVSGPTKRDYNHPQPFRGSLAGMFWLYYGDTPVMKDHFETDEVHTITSSYRPPPAAVKLARKQFAPGQQLISSKPEWQVWKEPLKKVKPKYWETLYYSSSFQLGTLRGGTRNLDVNGFKVITDSSKRGADTFVSAPGRRPTRLGSAKYDRNAIPGESAVAQHRNLAIYLNRNSDVPFLWMWRRKYPVNKFGKFTFLKGEKTWIALRPIRLQITGVNEKLTEKARFEKDDDGKKRTRWNGYHIISSKLTEKKPYGFAIEVGDASLYKNYGDFKESLKESSSLQVNQNEINNGINVRFKGGQKHSVGLTFGKNQLTVRRNGTPRDLKAERVVYGGPSGTKDALVWQDWNGGTIRVRCGGSVFRATVKKDGTVTYSNKE